MKVQRHREERKKNREKDIFDIPIELGRYIVCLSFPQGQILYSIIRYVRCFSEAASSTATGNSETE